MKYLNLFFLALLILINNCSPVQAAPVLELTAKEKAYIQNHGPVKLVVDPDWYPYEELDKKSNYRGIAPDLLKLISERTGLIFEVVPTKNWNETIRLAQEGKADAVSLLNSTEDRREWLLFSNVYYSDPNVLITREEHDYISDLSRFTQETMVLPTGTSIEEKLRKDYPSLKIILVESEPQAIQMVKERKADMTLRSLSMAAYHINKYGYFNLKVAGEMPNYVNDFRIGITKQDTTLQNILNKGIATITPQEVQEAINHHISIKIQKGFDYHLFFLVLSACFLIFLVSVFWMRKLYKVNKKLQQRQEELTELSSQLAESEFFYKSILQASPEAIIVSDTDEKIIMASPSTKNIIDVTSVDNLIGKYLIDFIVPTEHAKVQDNISKLKNAEPLGTTFYQLNNSSAEKIFIEVNSRVIKNPQDGTHKMISIIRNATEKINNELLLQYRANKYQELVSDLEAQNKLLHENISIDKMTGIKNRYYFEQRVLEEIKIADYNKQPLALLLFDIDNFKKVNDTYGHDIGDKIIIRITQTTTNIIRATDLFARWGGEEFVILMPKTSLTTAKERAEQLRQAIEEISHPETGSVTISIGVAEWQATEIPANWFKRADKALYSAKHNGRNRVEVSTSIETVDPLNLTWSDSFNSGHSKIDKQHRELLDICVMIMKTALEPKNAEKLTSIFSQLIKHVQVHFESEEQVLREINYPDLTKHCELHQKLLLKLANILKNTPTNELLSQTIVAFIINDVVMGHLLQEDIKFFHMF